MLGLPPRCDILAVSGWVEPGDKRRVHAEAQGNACGSLGVQGALLHLEGTGLLPAVKDGWEKDVSCVCVRERESAHTCTCVCL